jgi:hypothetical protein
MNINNAIIKANQQLHKDSIIKIKIKDNISKGSIEQQDLSTDAVCHPLYLKYISNMP